MHEFMTYFYRMEIFLYVEYISNFTRYYVACKKKIKLYWKLSYDLFFYFSYANLFSMHF